MKTFASALLLALTAVAAHASDPLGRAIETRDWASGTTKCESVAADEARRPDRTQPVLASAKALPIHAFVTFDALRHWRFTPARVNGEPVVSVYRLTVSTSSPTPIPGIGRR